MNTCDKFSKDLPISRRVFGKLSTAGLLTMAYPINRVYAQAGQKGPRRFFVLNQSGGFWQQRWSSAGPGGSLVIGDSHEALAPYTDHIVAIKGLDNAAGRNSRVHFLGPVTLLTGCNTSTANVKALSSARSLDQILSDQLSDNVPFSSIETGFRTKGIGSQERISYAAPNSPKNPVNSGATLFEKLFKGKAPGTNLGGASAPVDSSAIEREVRVLDGIVDQIKMMQRELVGDDKERLEKHIETIREIEKRVELSAGGGAAAGCIVPETAGRLDAGPKEAELLLDLTTQAFVCGLTNVGTYSTRKGAVDMIYDWMPEHTEVYGTKTHHGITHTEKLNTPQADAYFTKVDKFHTGLLARLVKTFAETPEADGSGTMLDNSLILYTTCISKPNAHSHRNMSWMVIGGQGSDLWKGNRCVDVQGEKLHNIHVSVMRAFGNDVNQFGNSTVNGGAASGPSSALKV